MSGNKIFYSHFKVMFPGTAQQSLHYCKKVLHGEILAAGGRFAPSRTQNIEGRAREYRANTRFYSLFLRWETSHMVGKERVQSSWSQPIRNNATI